MRDEIIDLVGQGQAWSEQSWTMSHGGRLLYYAMYYDYHSMIIAGHSKILSKETHMSSNV